MFRAVIHFRISLVPSWILADLAVSVDRLDRSRRTVRAELARKAEAAEGLDGTAGHVDRQSDPVVLRHRCLGLREDLPGVATWRSLEVQRASVLDHGGPFRHQEDTRCRATAEAYGGDLDDYVLGADAAGFLRVAQTGTAHGVI